MQITDFLQQYGLTLNAQQQEAVSRTDGHTLLLAVPGSGKTTVIIARLGYLIFGHHIDPARILTLSYNVAAVNDLKKRFAAQFGEQTDKTPEFRTINGFCAQVLFAYSRMTGGTPFRLMDTEGESTRLLRQTFRELTDSYPSELQLNELQRLLSYARNHMLQGEALQSLHSDTIDIPTLLQAYTAKKHELHVMDYDDQLEFAYRALKKYPALLARYQQQFPYIQVDEAQDVSLLQHEIIRLLVTNSTGLLLVGDEDQSIYGFRAAYPDALFSFTKYYPNGVLLTLEQNYRSTDAIVSAANRLIRFNQNRHNKHMHTDRSGGTPPQRVLLRSRAVQYAWLADYAAACRTQTALLYRNNDSVLPLIDLLTARKIPFYCRGHDALYFSQPAIANLCDGLRFAHSPHDETLFRTLYYKFGLPVSRAMMEDVIARHRAAPQIPLFTLLADTDDVPDTLCARARTLQRQLDRAAHMKTIDALQLLYSETALAGRDGHKGDPLRLDALMALAAQNPIPDRFIARLAELRAMIADGFGSTDAPFILSTIHSAKGLEFDRVILMDVWDGILPSVDSTEHGRISAEELLEEERRLFYVGVTRAKNHLQVLEYGAKTDDLRAPRFLRELFGLTSPDTAPSGKAVNIPSPFIAGSRVHHRLLGYGTVTACDGKVVAVCFDSPHRERRLDLQMCQKDGLLSLADKK